MRVLHYLPRSICELFGFKLHRFCVILYFSSLIWHGLYLFARRKYFSFLSWYINPLRSRKSLINWNAGLKSIFTTSNPLNFVRFNLNYLKFANIQFQSSRNWGKSFYFIFFFFQILTTGCYFLLKKLFHQK